MIWLFDFLMGRMTCSTGFHDWTCKAMQGIPPNNIEKPAIGDNSDLIIFKFHLYALTYCSRCSKVMDLSLKELSRQYERAG